MDKSTLGKIVLTATVAVCGVGFLVKSSVSSAQHYKMVDALMSSRNATATSRSTLLRRQ